VWRLLVFVVWAVLVALFAAENAQPVRLRFLVWQAPRVPEALVMLLSVAPPPSGDSPPSS
jgi:uncharacterized integral membrane protein